MSGIRQHPISTLTLPHLFDCQSHGADHANDSTPLLRSRRVGVMTGTLQGLCCVQRPLHNLNLVWCIVNLDEAIIIPHCGNCLGCKCVMGGGDVAAYSFSISLLNHLPQCLTMVATHEKRNEHYLWSSIFHLPSVHHHNVYIL